jgi:DNA polymerase III subunit delta
MASGSSFSTGFPEIEDNGKKSQNRAKCERLRIRMELKSSEGLQRVTAEIQKANVAPVYLVEGDENFLVKDACQKIVEALLPGKAGLGLEIFEGDENWENAIISLKTYPFFGARRVVLVKDTQIFYSKFAVEEVLQRSRDRAEQGDMGEAVRLFRAVLGYLDIEKVDEETTHEVEALTGVQADGDTRKWMKKMAEECLARGLGPLPYEDHSVKLNDALKKGLPPSNVLVLSVDSADRRKKLYKTISEIGIALDLSVQRLRRDAGEIDEEERRTLRRQSDELLETSGKQFSKGAFERLTQKTGFNVGIFQNELEKVILSVPDKHRIEAEDIEASVGRTREDSAFDLQKAVGERNIEKALFYLHELLDQGEFYLALLQSVANEIRRLIAAQDFLQNELSTRWDPQQDVERFKRAIYFPIVLKLKREKEKDPGFKKSRYNILKLPAEVLIELLRASRNFTRQELYEAIRLLAATDLKTKKAGVSPVQLVEQVLVEICLKKKNGGAQA